MALHSTFRHFAQIISSLDQKHIKIVDCPASKDPSCQTFMSSPYRPASAWWWWSIFEVEKNCLFSVSASTRQLLVLDMMENRYADDRYDQLHVELHFSHGYVDGRSLPNCVRAFNLARQLLWCCLCTRNVNETKLNRHHFIHCVFSWCLTTISLSRCWSKSLRSTIQVVLKNVSRPGARTH